MGDRREVNWLIRDKYQGIEPYLMTKVQKISFEDDVKRIEAGEPLAYVIGWINFLGCQIDLSKKPLIPRAETEFWTSQFISECGGPTATFSTLDMFAGSGCSGIAVLKHIPNVHVTFIDIDQMMLEQVKINLKLNNIDDSRCTIIHSNIFSNVRMSYDYILANPPYISKNDEEVQESVSKYEPAGALWSGGGGLEHIKKFLKEAREHLNLEGKIYMEFGSEQKMEVGEIIRDCEYSKWEFFRDQFDRDRYVVASL